MASLRLLTIPISALLVAAACGSTSESTEDASTTDTSAEAATVELPASEEEAAEEEAAEEAAAGAGIRLVDAAAGLAIQTDPPEDLVILDVRTAEEFDEGHLEGAIMLDFYQEDFAQQLAELDPDVPYLLYCRSGNRSGETAALMEDLGFNDVADVDGGILAWAQGGNPIITP